MISTRDVVAALGSDPMPWASAALLAVTMFGSGLFLIWIGGKSAAGTLKRNWFVGIRTRTTLASDEAWRAAHMAGATATTWAGVASVVSGLALLARPSNTIGLVVVFVGLAIMLVLVVVSMVKGQRAAKKTVPDGDGF